MAIDARPRRHRPRERRDAAVPRGRRARPRVHTAFFFSTPGSVYRATQSGTWGDAREASVEYGERYLDVVEAATLRMLDDIERTFAAMPPR